MNTADAFVMGMANSDKPMMVFDWDKAARRIRESGCQTAEAGLRGDWEWTGGEIFTGGKTNTEDYTYLASTWATPELDVGDGPEPCYVMEDETDWDSNTKWPDSALAILRGEDAQ